MKIKTTPKIKKKETKSEKRLFRFTPTHRSLLDKLTKRYGTNESKVVDILIEVTGKTEFLNVLDKFVAENYAT